MKKIIILIVILMVGYILYYTISPLWNTIEVNDDEGGNIPVSIKRNIAIKTENDKTQQVTPSESKIEEPASKPTKPQLVSGKRINIEETFGHPTSGTVRVITRENGTRFARYEDFKTINGPRLHVYLATDETGKDFIDLGPASGTQGNINYEIPPHVNLDTYSHILYYCVPFGVVFNYANIGQF